MRDTAVIILAAYSVLSTIAVVLSYLAWRGANIDRNAAHEFIRQMAVQDARSMFDGLMQQMQQRRAMQQSSNTNVN